MQGAPDGGACNAQRDYAYEQIHVIVARGKGNKPVDAESYTEQRSQVPVPFIGVQLLHNKSFSASCAQDSLERDDLIGWIAGERSIEIGEAAHMHALDGANGAIAAVLVWHRQPALVRALVAQHQQDALFGCDLAQALAEWIALAQRVRVIVKKEHAHHFGSVAFLLQLW